MFFQHFSIAPPFQYLKLDAFLVPHCSMFMFHSSHPLIAWQPAKCLDSMAYNALHCSC